MVMTLRDHADLEAEGATSPHQVETRRLQAAIRLAERTRDREERRLRRLTRIQVRAAAKRDLAILDIMVAMQALREMKA
jgi:hypothetical protein